MRFDSPRMGSGYWSVARCPAVGARSAVNHRGEFIATRNEHSAICRGKVSLCGFTGAAAGSSVKTPPAHRGSSRNGCPTNGVVWAEDLPDGEDSSCHWSDFRCYSAGQQKSEVNRNTPDDQLLSVRKRPGHLLLPKRVFGRPGQPIRCGPRSSVG